MLLGFYSGDYFRYYYFIVFNAFRMLQIFSASVCFPDKGSCAVETEEITQPQDLTEKLV